MAKEQITKKIVNAAIPQAKPIFIYDSSLSGFGLKVNPTGSKSFIIEYRSGVGGRLARKRRIMIGLASELTPDQARKKARLYLAKARVGKDPVEERNHLRTIPDFRTFSKQYLDQFAAKHLKPSTIANYETNIRKHAMPHIGPMKLNQITRREIQIMHTKIGDKSEIQANRTLKTISAIYRYAQTMGLVSNQYNPTQGVRSFSEPMRERYLSEAEFVRLGMTLKLAETDGIPWELDSSAPISKHLVGAEYQFSVFSSSAIDSIRLLIFTGCRLREILNLTWKEVDMERGLLFLADSKTGARAIVLNQQSLAILTRQEMTGKYVFPGQYEDKPRADLNKPWRAVRRHAGIPDLRLHDLRHSFASVGANAGMGLPIVGALLGHKHASTTQRYAHLDTNPLRQASDQIGNHISKIMKMEISKN